MFRVFLKPAVSVAWLLSLAGTVQAIEVYMFRGAGDFSFVQEDLHFSRGLHVVADKLRAEGIHAEVRGFSRLDATLNSIKSRKPKSVAFVGHSMGALASMALAKKLKSSGVSVEYMALIDIPGPVGVAGDNVRKVENYYSINPVYGKLTNVSTHPDAKNVHVTGFIHNRMDDSPTVQNGILSAIRAIHTRENGRYAQAPETTPSIAQTEDLNYRLGIDPTTTASVNAPTPKAAIQPETWRQTTSSTSTSASPFLLPSVRPQGDQATVSNGENTNAAQPQPSQSGLRSTVSNVVDQGRSLLGRATDYVQNWRSRREQRAAKFGPQQQ